MCKNTRDVKGAKKMKLSQYNFIYTNVLKNSNVSVIYNARTGALAVLTPQNYSQLKNLEEHNLPITDKNFEKQLLQCGYLLPKDFDELQQIKYDLLQNRFNPAYMDLTIAPTLACNFRCIYCFEKGQRRSQTMSEQTIQKIISFVRAQANHLEELSITWYGGEPLLALPQLESISKQLWDLCDEFHINYSSSIITNGYLLDVNTANILKNNHVDEIQITIDGPKPIHDKRRPLANDGGTFDTIMEHLLQIKGILPVNIRINTDYEYSITAYNHYSKRHYYFQSRYFIVRDYFFPDSHLCFSVFCFSKKVIQCKFKV